MTNISKNSIAFAEIFDIIFVINPISSQFFLSLSFSILMSLITYVNYSNQAQLKRSYRHAGNLKIRLSSEVRGKKTVVCELFRFKGKLLRRCDSLGRFFGSWFFLFGWSRASMALLRAKASNCFWRVRLWYFECVHFFYLLLLLLQVSGRSYSVRQPKQNDIFTWLSESTRKRFICGFFFCVALFSDYPTHHAPEFFPCSFAFIH